MGKMLKKKKALSDVVATVLIILLTVIAGAIIAQFIVPYVKDSLAESSECLDYNNGYFQFEEKIGLKDAKKYNCLKKGGGTTNYFGASIKARPSEQEVIDKVDGFNLVFIGETDSKSIVVKSGKKDSNFRTICGMVNMPLPIPSNGEVFTYVHRSFKNYIFMEVYPILKSGKECTSSRDRIAIEPCFGVDLTC